MSECKCYDVTAHNSINNCGICIDINTQDAHLVTKNVQEGYAHKFKFDWSGK